MIRDVPTKILITQLRQAASVWLKDSDLLKLEEIFTRLLDAEKELHKLYSKDTRL